jgi:hypothetical protein
LENGVIRKYLNAIKMMTEKEFRELFGDHDEHYIQIKDLREILVKPSEVLVSDSLLLHQNEIWGPTDKTMVTAIRALQSTFGKDWDSTLTFPKLVKELKRLSYIKGVGKKTLNNIIKLCELEGFMVSASLLTLKY